MLMLKMGSLLLIWVLVVTIITASDTGYGQQDTEAPSWLLCPTGFIATSNPVTYPVPSATDNIDTTLDVTCSPESEIEYTPGYTDVTCTVTDDAGNPASCTFTIILDVDDPTITCADILSMTPVTITAPPTSDNTDPSPSVTCNPAVGEVVDTGAEQVTCTATDEARRQDSCTFTITVDTEAPKFSCPTDFITIFNPVKYTVPSATDNIDTTLQVTCSPYSEIDYTPGETEVTCTVTDDAGNPASCTFTITLDINDPTITCTDILSMTPVTITAPPTSDKTDPSTSVTCTPGVGEVVDTGAEQVTCTAIDEARRQDSCTFTITVDTQAPQLSCPTDFIAKTNPVTYNVPSATDNYIDTTLQVSCSPGSGIDYTPGDTVVTCMVTDDAGNQASCSFIITLDPVRLPVNCTDLDPKGFSSTDGRKCYFPELQGPERNFSSAVSFCQNLEIEGFDDWILMNPRNLIEHLRIRKELAKIGSETDTYWWLGQHELSEGVFVNIDDPPECPGIYLQWQKGEFPQPNGNHGTTNDQDCIIMSHINGGVGDEPFQDKACDDKQHTFCKHLKPNPAVNCSYLHSNAFQRPGDDSACYLADTQDKRTFYEAIKFCEQLTDGEVDWHIANVLNREEAQFLRDPDNGLYFGSDIRKDGVWVGQNDILDEEVYRYVNQSSYCPPVFVHWRFNDEPDGPLSDSESGQQDCIAIKPYNIEDSEEFEGAEDVECSSEYLTTCEITILKCKPGWKLYGYHCYRLSSTATTFEEAEKVCQHSGSHLTSIHSALENEFVSRLSDKSIWIGLTDQCEEDSSYHLPDQWEEDPFGWTDRTKVDYVNWLEREPNDFDGSPGADCTASHGKWFDEKCNTNRKYVCKKDVDTEKPVFDFCPSSLLNISTDPGQPTAMVEWQNLTAYDNSGEIPDITCNYDSGTNFTIGEFTVDCVAVDGSENKETCRFQITVQDNEGPVFNLCPEVPMEKSTDPGQSTAMVEWPYPMAHDNSGEILSVTCTYESGTNLSIGSFTVDCLAVDGSGNKQECQFEIIVQDIESPQFDFCPSTLLDISTEPGHPNAMGEWFNPVAHDNSGEIPSTTCKYKSATNFAVGEPKIMVDCIAVDGSGNNETCLFQILVRDDKRKVSEQINCNDREELLYDWDALPMLQSELDMDCAALTTFEVSNAKQSYTLNDGSLTTEVRFTGDISEYGVFMTMGILKHAQTSFGKDLSVGKEQNNLQSQEEDTVTYKFGSKIIGINLFGADSQQVALGDNSRIVIQHALLPTALDETINNTVNVTPGCYFYDLSGFWSEYGCEVISVTNSHVTCSCDHLTSFAILMQLVEIEIPQEHQFALHILTIVGIAISCICIIIALCIFGWLRMYKKAHVVMHANLAVSILLGQLTFVFGIDTSPRKNCIAVTILLHYFFTAIFMWMLMEGVFVYVKLKPTMKWSNKPLRYMAAAWGTPVIITMITFGVRHRMYGANDICWLPINNGVIYAFAGPALFIIVINTVILYLALETFKNLRMVQKKNERERIRAIMRAAVILEPLLGLTWVFGILQFEPNSAVFFSYLFNILNTSQGVFILVSQCLMDDEVQTILKRRFSSRVGNDSTKSHTASTNVIPLENIQGNIG